jgi:hypothetical protein
MPTRVRDTIPALSPDINADELLEDLGKTYVVLTALMQSDHMSPHELHCLAHVARDYVELAIRQCDPDVSILKDPDLDLLR